MCTAGKPASSRAIHLWALCTAAVNYPAMVRCLYDRRKPSPTRRREGSTTWLSCAKACVTLTVDCMGQPVPSASLVELAAPQLIDYLCQSLQTAMIIFGISMLYQSIACLCCRLLLPSISMMGQVR